MSKVILTGASGFIGHHCIDPLLARGYEVHAISSKAPPRADSRGVRWHQCDLSQPGSADALLAAVQPTHMLHLAWYVVPGKLITAPENFTWVTASLDLARAFAGNGGKRLVVCGSGYEYDWNYGYCSEKLTPQTPNTIYGACKQALHLMLTALGEQAGLSVGWGRVFFLYGPHEHPQRLVSSVILSLLRSEPAKTSHGRQIRDYMHVQDVADGLVALLDSDMRGAVNVASGQATTIRDIVLAAGRLLQREDLIQIGAIPARANDSPLVVGDNSRLIAELDWSQKFDLETGLAHTIEWWKAHKQG